MAARISAPGRCEECPRMALSSFAGKYQEDI